MKIKCKNIKLPEENIREKSVCFVNKFLYTTLKAGFLKEKKKKDNLDLNKNQYSKKDNVRIEKVTYWEKIFSRHISNKELMSTGHRVLL